MKNRKICFFINTLNNSGGTERITVLLAHELIARGFLVTIITWYGGIKSFYPLDPRLTVLTVNNKESGNIYLDYPRSLYRYRKLLAKLKPDRLIDVCVALSLLSVPAKIGYKFKLLAWEHFNVGVNWNAVTAKLSRTLAAKFADKIITLTEGDKQAYEEKFNAGNVVCIPNPITLFPKQSASKPSEKIVLAVGRLTYQKGFDILLRIWKQVSARFNDWNLRIAGDGELRTELADLCESYGIAGSVTFLGAVKDIGDEYGKASVLAMSSRFEGLPLVLLEAKAFGLPIVAFDCETGPREIIQDQRDGILVPALDEVAFSESLIKLMSDSQLRSEFSQNATKDSERFALAPIVAEWVKVLEA